MVGDITQTQWCTASHPRTVLNAFCTLELGHDGYHISKRPSIAWQDQPADKSDAINPAHYTSDPSGIEAITITRHRNFNIGNALKYLWRAGLKDEKAIIEDLKKAIWYINDEIARLEGKK